MLNDFSEYHFVTLDERSSCPVDGSIKPLKFDLNCRGEDVLFMAEAWRERKEGWKMGNTGVQVSAWNSSLEVYTNDSPQNPYVSADVEVNPWVEKRNFVRQFGNGMLHGSVGGYEGITGRGDSRFYVHPTAQGSYFGCTYGCNWNEYPPTDATWVWDVGQTLRLLGRWDDSAYQHILDAMRIASQRLKGWRRTGYNVQQDTQFFEDDFGYRFPLKVRELYQGVALNNLLQIGEFGAYDCLSCADSVMCRCDDVFYQYHGLYHYKQDNITTGQTYEYTTDKGYDRDKISLNDQYVWQNDVTERGGQTLVTEQETYNDYDPQYGFGADVFVRNPDFRANENLAFVPAQLVVTYDLSWKQGTAPVQNRTCAIICNGSQAHTAGTAVCYKFPSYTTSKNAANEAISHYSFSKTDNSWFRMQPRYAFVRFQCDWKSKWW